MRPAVIIFIRGGMVQGAVSNHPDVSVLIADYDCDLDTENIQIDPTDNELVYIFDPDTQFNPETTDQYIEAYCAPTTLDTKDPAV